MSRPTDCRYSETHEWARKEGPDVVVGITDHAVSELGELVFCAFKKKVGDRVTAREPFGEIESVKAVSDLNSPITGTVVEVNPAVADALDLVAQDPFGSGWMLRVKPDAASEFEKLLDAAAYEKHVAAEH